MKHLSKKSVASIENAMHHAMLGTVNIASRLTESDRIGVEMYNEERNRRAFLDNRLQKVLWCF